MRETVYMLTGEQYEQLTGKKLIWKLKYTKPLIFLLDDGYGHGFSWLSSGSVKKRFDPSGRPSSIRTYTMIRLTDNQIREFFEKNAVNLSELGITKPESCWYWRVQDVEKFIEEKNLFTPVENPEYESQKTQDLEEAQDGFGNPVHVGDTVAFVVMSGYQKLRKGVVTRITSDNFVITYNYHQSYSSHYVAPHGYVTKQIDLETLHQKYYTEGYEDGYKDGELDAHNDEYGRSYEPTQQNRKY